jgi:hypothetical protein
MAKVAATEPNLLAGKRLIFTSWFYVRPGGFQWHDREGNPLPQITRQSLDPWEAEFRPLPSPPTGIRLSAQPAKHMGPLIGKERPWEAKGLGLGVVIHDEGVYRAWGICQAADDEQFPCYFESRDGLNWERPELGLIEYQGSKKNNLLGRSIKEGVVGSDGRTKFFGWGVFKDPSAPPEERYKAVTPYEITPDEFEDYKKRRPDAWEPRAIRHDKCLGIGGGVSPDGLNWKWTPDPLVIEHSDTHIIAYYDEYLQNYVMHTRSYTYRKGMNISRRAIGRSISSDFREFPVSETIMCAGPEMLPSDTLYTNCKTTIPGAPDQHLMFPAIWHQDDDTTSIAMASFHHGEIWHFVPGSPVFETADFGAWDGGCIFAHPNLIEIPDGDFALPYTGYIFTHKYPRGQHQFLPGYAIWPKGRIVALEARDSGEFMTTALMPPGRRLKINAVTKRAGGIRVEIVGSDGQAVQGRAFADSDAIIGDRHGTPVTWKGEDDLGHAEGTAIMLRFRMDKAKIFGLEFE